MLTSGEAGHITQAGPELRATVNSALEANVKAHLTAASEAISALSAPRTTSVVDLVQAALNRLGAAWTAHRRHVQEMSYLQAMDDRQLRDLGLTRLDVRALIGGYYRLD
jgi:uncharacterized protein YjiS (DUF1127 family)